MQTHGCHGNYEVGDILEDFNCPPVKGENGYNTRSKSLAFFSYFYGALSLAVNGYSSNNTHTSDAGPVCNLL